MSVKVAENWQKAVNEKKMDALLRLSDKNIEMAGPRSSGFGHKLLVEWVERAGLTLKTLNKYEKGDTVVLEQHGVWKNDEGQMTGEANVSTVMKIRDGKVIYLARYDNDLSQALHEANLTEADKVK